MYLSPTYIFPMQQIVLGIRNLRTWCSSIQMPQSSYPLMNDYPMWCFTNLCAAVEWSFSVILSYQNNIEQIWIHPIYSMTRGVVENCADVQNFHAIGLPYTEYLVFLQESFKTKSELDTKQILRVKDILKASHAPNRLSRYFALRMSKSSLSRLSTNAESLIRFDESLRVLDSEYSSLLHSSPGAFHRDIISCLQTVVHDMALAIHTSGILLNDYYLRYYIQIAYLNDIVSRCKEISLPARTTLL
jgi:hypothetical protein